MFLKYSSEQDLRLNLFHISKICYRNLKIKTWFAFSEKIWNNYDCWSSILESNFVTCSCWHYVSWKVGKMFFRNFVSETFFEQNFCLNLLHTARFCSRKQIKQTYCLFFSEKIWNKIYNTSQVCSSSIKNFEYSAYKCSLPPSCDCKSFVTNLYNFLTTFEARICYIYETNFLGN